MSIRVAGIAITPPGIKASGGVSAGIQLMKRVAERAETHMLVMADEDGVEQDGALTIHRMKATNAIQRTPIGRFVPRGLVTLFWRVDFGAWLDRVKPDIVHIHNPHPPGALLAAARACDARDIPYVISTHGFVEFDDYATAFGAKPWQRPIIDRLIRVPLVQTTRGAARVLMLSPEEKPIFDGMGIEPARLGVVPNGVDPWFLDSLDEADRLAAVARFALPADKPKILFVGNHTPNKGIDVLLKAMMRMREPAVAVIGGGIRSPEEHKAMLADAGFDMASGRAIFTDFLSRDELKGLYQSCDIFAFPSRADTLPLVILEAMVSRLPVVATRIGGIPFEVTDETGALIDSGDTDGLARELDRIAADPALRRSMGAAGRQRAIDIFNWDRSAEESIRIYSEILNGPSGAARRAGKTL
jgi:glycosyltransferase involved in cell wall biosynthesis